MKPVFLFVDLNIVKNAFIRKLFVSSSVKVATSSPFLRSHFGLLFLFQPQEVRLFSRTFIFNKFSIGEILCLIITKETSLLKLILY
jgi:hypothetical protein